MDVQLTFRQKDRSTPPLVLHVWRTSDDRRYAWESYQSETNERRQIGVRAVRRLITDSMRSLINQPSTNSLLGVLEGRAIDRKVLNICWVLVSLPCMSLSTLLGVYSYPSLTAPPHPRSAPLTYWQPGPLGQSELL